jgi:hypothetical protein
MLSLQDDPRNVRLSGENDKDTVRVGSIGESQDKRDSSQAYKLIDKS